MSASERHIRARPAHLPAARSRARAQPIQPPARSAATAPDARNIIEFRNVDMHYPTGRHRPRRRDVQRPPGRVRLPRRLDRLGQVDDHEPAHQGARRDRRHDPRRRPPARDDGPHEDPVLPAQHRRRLPGLQAAAQPHGATTTSPTRCRPPARRARTSARRSPTCCASRASRRSCTTTPTSSPAARSSASSVARAFVNHPPLLLADEPTGNLDPRTSLGIMQLLYRIYRTGTTVMVATHDSHMVDRMRRRVIELRGGRRSSATRRAACTPSASRRPTSSAA